MYTLEENYQDALDKIEDLQNKIEDLQNKIYKVLNFINAWKDNKTDLKVSMLDLLQIEDILRGEDNE